MSAAPSPPQNARVPGSRLMLADLAGVVIGLGPGAIAWGTGLWFLREIWSRADFLPILLLLPVLVVGVFLAVTWIWRLCLPRLKPGVHELNSPGMRTWYLHFVLANGLYAAGLKTIIYSTYLTRFLYFRAMGAKVGYSVNSSIFVTLRDFPLISIGAGSSLAAYAHIAGHSFVGEKMLLGTVEIGERCFIGMDVIVGPRTRVGAGSWIGFGNRLLMDRVPENSKIDNLEWAEGSPKHRRSKADSGAGSKEEAESDKA